MSRTTSKDVPIRSMHARAQPVLGYVIGIATILAMIVLTVAMWDAMPDRIVTREADGRHGESAPHKAFSSAVSPVVLAIVLVLMTLAPAWNRMLEKSPLRSGTDEDARRRGLNVLLVFTSMAMLAVHVGVTSLYTGTGPSMAQVGALIVGCAGVSLAAMAWIAGRRSDTPSPGLRMIVLALGVVSVLTIGVSLRSPVLGLAIGSVSLLFFTVMLGGAQFAGFLARRRASQS